MWGLADRFIRQRGKLKPALASGSGRRRRSRPWLETLETREMLTATGGPGVDYTLMGGKWDNSQTITFSIPPDGVSWGSGTDNLNATLDSQFGGTSWVGLISDALQVWSTATNLNFQLVSDGNYGFNVSGMAEGDPRFGDIRIGGYNLGTSTTIAQTYGPPPNGQTGSGDVMLNTSINFAPGSGYDFETVMIHELGHALGLGESPQPSSDMYSYYSGVHHSLSPYDVEGIQSLYGARNADQFQSQGQATSPTTAVDLTPYLNSSEQAQLSGVSLSSVGDTEFFSVVVPQINGSTLKVAAQAGGFSQLSPRITLIEPTTGAVLTSVANPAVDGGLALTSIPGVVPGHRYLIEVSGATSDNFAEGSYAIQVGFFGGVPVYTAPAPTPVSTPTPTPAPVTQAPVSTPVAPVIQPDGYAYNASFANATELGAMGNAISTAANLTLPSGQNYQLFAFEAQTAGTVLVAAGNVNVVVGNSMAIPVVQGTGLLEFYAPKAGARYFLLFLSSNATPVPNYGFALRVIPAAPTPVSITTRLNAVRAASVNTANQVPVKIAAATPKITTKVTTRPNQ